MIDFRIPHPISSISDRPASAAGSASAPGSGSASAPASVPGPAASSTSTYQATPYLIFRQEAF